MNATSPFVERLQAAIERPTSGVIGIVDTLLKACPGQDIRLDWQEGYCRVRVRTSGDEIGFATLLRQSVFRAILARVAEICNEQFPRSVSPYGGQSRLPVGGDQRTWSRVTFANTSESSWLSLRSLETSELIEELRQQNAQLRAELAARPPTPRDLYDHDVWPEMQRNYYDSFIA
jgi:hypothetical protein